MVGWVGEGIARRVSKQPLLRPTLLVLWVMDQRADLGLAGHPEFGQDVAHVGFHRLGRDHQVFRHLPIGVPGGDQRQNFVFPPGEGGIGNGRGIMKNLLRKGGKCSLHGTLARIKKFV